MHRRDKVTSFLMLGAAAIAVLAMAGSLLVSMASIGSTIYHGSIAAAKWEMTGGEITSVTAEKACGRSGQRREVVVAYRYSVNGAPYTNDWVGFDVDECASPREADELLGAYRRGAFTNVFYNPDNPAQAILRTGLKSETYIAGALSLLWMVAAVYWAFRKWQRIQRRVMT